MTIVIFRVKRRYLIRGSRAPTKGVFPERCRKSAQLSTFARQERCLGNRRLGLPAAGGLPSGGASRSFSFWQDIQDLLGTQDTRARAPLVAANRRELNSTCGDRRDNHVVVLFRFAVLSHARPVRVDLCGLPGRVIVFAGRGVAFANGLLPCRAHWLLASLGEARRRQRSKGEPQSKCRDRRSQMLVDSDHGGLPFFGDPHV
jgi:hypothetical protein